MSQSFIKQKGFTLIEMIVAVSIFVIVAMMVSLVFVSLARSNRKAQDLKLLIDNINFTMDAMVLDLKFGQNYSCGARSASGCTEIGFQDGTKTSHTYEWKQDENRTGRIYKDGAALTADGVDVYYANFVIANSAGTNPFVRLFISGEAKPVGGVSTKFNLQTAVSERNL